MRPVRAEFAPRRVPGRIAWVLLAVVFAAVLAVAGFVVQDRASLNDDRAALMAAVTAKNAVATTSPKLTPPPPYARSAQEMLAEHRLAWPRVLTALEATALVGVTPTAVEMVASDGVARVEVSFSDHARLLEYLEALNAGGGELHWVLMQTQAQPGGSPTAVLLGKPRL